MDALFGNRNVANILLFMSLHRTCYGTQLMRELDLPLTPIQHALERLERGEIITSRHQGKTKLYQFNPAYPLLGELLALLKRAYTLLPWQERLRFSRLYLFWTKLAAVGRLQSFARGKEGTGVVQAVLESEEQLLFYEKGRWSEGIDFQNVLSWRLDVDKQQIALEHLRRGKENPVFLLNLVPGGSNMLVSKEAHICKLDRYEGKLFLEKECLRLVWRVQGPKKQEELETYYF